MYHSLNKNKFKHTLKLNKNTDTIINIGDITIGYNTKTIIGGPCTIKDFDSLDLIASKVKSSGGTILRGGAFKPRTSPHDFQGLGVDGYKIINAVSKKHGLLCVSEVTSITNLDDACKYLDILQIGTRNMQNFELLKAIGKTKKPVLLKRGFSSTLEEWLLSAEYILNKGNPNVILCERGIRTFETFTRNTLDLTIVPILKNLSHLPVFVDPSHGVGLSEYVMPMSIASIACGADGLIIETDIDPKTTISDGRQTINTNTFKEICNSIL